MHKESGEAWTLDKADAVEVEYKRFLTLQKMYPQESIAPLFDVDIFWHYHILDTMKYAVDCQAVFGYFLHHFPYLGLRGEADEEAHELQGQRGRELYRLAFGADYPVNVWEQERSDVSAAPQQSAWSASLPREPALATAWSASLPREPAMTTAWSASLPREPAMLTAWSASLPREPAMTTAWSASLPREPAQATAWSASLPRGTNTPAVRFNLSRPALVAAS
jgi:hypothetical protein